MLSGLDTPTRRRRGGEGRGKEACPSAGIIQIKFTGISQNNFPPAYSPGSAGPVAHESKLRARRDMLEKSEHPDAIFCYSYLDLQAPLRVTSCLGMDSVPRAISVEERNRIVQWFQCWMGKCDEAEYDGEPENGRGAEERYLSHSQRHTPIFPSSHLYKVSEAKSPKPSPVTCCIIVTKCTYDSIRLRLTIDW